MLSPKGGALGKMLTPFKMGLGGRIGDGRQWMSWIAVIPISWQARMMRTAISPRLAIRIFLNISNQWPGHRIHKHVPNTRFYWRCEARAEISSDTTGGLPFRASESRNTATISNSGSIGCR